MYNIGIFITGSVLTCLFVLTGLSQSDTTYFTYTSRTGNNATVLISETTDIKINGELLEAGDEIGVFTPDSFCVGAVVWNDENTAITVWGDNEFTDEKDGIEPGEQMHFRIWKKNLQKEFIQTEIIFSDEFPATGNDTYAEDGIYVIELLKADLVVNVTEDYLTGTIPESFSLNQNYPNPFNPLTTIGYSVPEASHVRITVFNVIGQKVEEIVNGFHMPDRYRITFEGNNLPSGIYFYRMEAGDFIKTKKFILLQ